MTTITPFTGFPMAGIQFLRDLTVNNNKPWFEEHKNDYMTHVQAPAISLVKTLGEKIQSQFPEISYDTRTNGAGSLMRLHRDTRFSADKSPYKTNIAMMFVYGQGKKMETPGFGIQITPEQVDVMAGIFAFPKPMLEKYREAVLHDKLGGELQAAAALVTQHSGYTLEGATYKKVPRGYDENTPYAEWLKYTGLHVFAPTVSLEVAQTPELIEVLLQHFIKMAPIQQWLIKALYER